MRELSAAEEGSLHVTAQHGMALRRRTGAAELLRQRGLERAEQKAGREARQGLIEAYIHAGGRIGAMVELNCETDFVARTPQFRELAHELAMQVAAMNPSRIGDESPDGETAVESGTSLLDQPYIRDSSK